MSRRDNERRSRYTSARKRAEQADVGFSLPYLKLPEGAKMFKPKPGIMLIDILPYEAGKGNPYAEKGMLHWERTFWTHRGIGANSESYLCARKNSGGRCPICEHRAKLMKEAPDEHEEQIKELAPKQRQLFNVINRREPDKGVQIFTTSYHVFGKVLDARLRNSDEEDEWDKFFFLEDGLTLKVGMEEDSFGGRAFVKAETIDFKPRKEPYDEEILEQVFCLDDMLVETDYDKLKSILLQTDEEGDEDDDEPKSKKKSSKDEEEDDEDEPKSKKSSKDEEDEEDEDDDDEPKSKKSKAPSDEEDDWDEFDAKQSKSKKSSKDEDDEDDDEPKSKSRKDEDEDDEEEPKSKKKSSKDEEEDDEWEERPRVKTKDEEDAEEDDEEEDRPRKKRR